jgi:hypothetical protein
MSSNHPPELKAEICELWKRHTATQIRGILAARGIFLTRNSIIGIVHRAGLKGHDKVLEHPLSRTSNGQRRPREVGKPRPRLRIVHGGQADMPDLRCAPVEPLHLTFEQLVSDSCRYPYGETNLTYCGHRAQHESSYCPHHHALCHEQTPRQRAAFRRFVA